MSESWQESMIKFLTRDDGTFDRDRLQMLADDLKTEAEEGYARTIEQTRTPEQELELAQKRARLMRGSVKTLPSDCLSRAPKCKKPIPMRMASVSGCLVASSASQRVN